MTQGRLQIEGLSHGYGRGHALALDDVSLDVAAGEFVSLLGPSGCGKTTLLRAISGFISPNSGAISLDGVDITNTPPNKRPINLVFQRPTLFPHLDVADNVEFGLRLAKVGRTERLSRVQDALDLVRLPDYARRRVHQLSGGQMQRVALARALVNRPKVLLLDEPLSALDHAIRLEMEVELRRVHRETTATFVYVTHDQREAMALSDRVAVFSQGRIAQLGSPYDVYQAPATGYVAGFVGDSNVLEAAVAAGRVLVAGHAVALVTTVEDGRYRLCLRREDVTISRLDPSHTVDGQLTGTVADVAYRGNAHTYRVTCKQLDAVLKVEQSGPPIEVGTDVSITWPNASARLVPSGE